jgi:hypothetical protein
MPLKFSFYMYINHFFKAKNFDILIPPLPFHRFSSPLQFEHFPFGGSTIGVGVGGGVAGASNEPTCR